LIEKHCVATAELDHNLLKVSCHFTIIKRTVVLDETMIPVGDAPIVGWVKNVGYLSKIETRMYLNRFEI
jgi:hypothetical protein